MTNCRLCQAPIKFDKQHVSQKSGKMIPLDPITEMAHDCPVWKKQRPYQPQQQSRPAQGPRYYQCRKGCGGEIYFHEKHKSDSGKYIPMERETDEPHDCSE